VQIHIPQCRQFVVGAVVRLRASSCWVYFTEQNISKASTTLLPRKPGIDDAGATL
jgi:hypothetical protein